MQYFSCKAQIPHYLFLEITSYVYLLSGGSIEAHPPSDSITSLTADILLKPDNSYTLLSTWDHIHSLPFYIWGGSVPQCSVDHNELNTIIDKISNAALERGLIGHVSIDFVTFISPTDVSIIFVLG